MNKSVLSFTKKTICLVAPFLVASIIYIVNDPYMVLHRYKRYDSTCLFLNEHYVGWQTYLNNRDSVHYDSFIMGNSFTMAFKSASWKKYLNSDDRVLRLFGNAERLSSVYAKIKALDKVHAPIKHILLVADKNLMDNTPLTPSALNLLPPGESNITNANFQKSFLQSFFIPTNMYAYLNYSICKTYHKYMKGVINPYGIVHDPVTLDAVNPHDKEIALYHDRYWTIFKSRFPQRSGLNADFTPVIKQSQKDLLLRIKQLCDKNHTDIKIIMGPDYKQVKFNPKDIAILQQIFGKNNVYDFTGINTYTEDIHNYYEAAHFRPTVGDKLLQVVYGQSSRSNSAETAAHNKL